MKGLVQTVCEIEWQFPRTFSIVISEDEPRVLLMYQVCIVYQSQACVIMDSKNNLLEGENCTIEYACRVPNSPPEVGACWYNCSHIFSGDNFRFNRKFLLFHLLISIIRAEGCTNELFTENSSKSMKTTSNFLCCWLSSRINVNGNHGEIDHHHPHLSLPSCQQSCRSSHFQFSSIMGTSLSHLWICSALPPCTGGSECLMSTVFR